MAIDPNDPNGILARERRQASFVPHWQFVVEHVEERLRTCREALEIERDPMVVRELQAKIANYKEILQLPEQTEAKAAMAN